MIETAGYTVISAGIVLNLLAAISLLRFKDVHSRLISSTKCVTFGTGLIFIGIFILNGFSPSGLKALMCAVFILLTSPVEAHALLKAARRAGVRIWNKEQPGDKNGR